MSAKENFNQAMNDMFGQTRETGSVPKTEYDPPLQTRVPATYLAAGTTIEGTIRSNGDVEIAGILKGDVESKGRVTLHTGVTGNIVAAELSIPSCKLEGDVDCTGKVFIGESATINGNIHAKELDVAGKVVGDIDVDAHITLEDTAIVNGNISTTTMSMNRGAILRGGIEMREAERVMKESFESEN